MCVPSLMAYQSVAILPAAMFYCLGRPLVPPLRGRLRKPQSAKTTCARVSHLVPTQLHNVRVAQPVRCVGLQRRQRRLARLPCQRSSGTCTPRFNPHLAGSSVLVQRDPLLEIGPFCSSRERALTRLYPGTFRDLVRPRQAKARGFSCSAQMRCAVKQVRELQQSVHSKPRDVLKKMPCNTASVRGRRDGGGQAPHLSQRCRPSCSC